MNMESQITPTHDFNEGPIRFIKSDDKNVDLWMTAEEIGNDLELEEPITEIDKIYQRHKDELEEFSMLLPTKPHGGPHEVRLFSEEGVYLITFFSQSPKAKEFRKWVARRLKF